MIWVKLFENISSFVLRVLAVATALFLVSFIWLYAIPYGAEQIDGIGRLEQLRTERDELRRAVNQAQAEMQSASEKLASLGDKPPMLLTWEYWPIISRVKYELWGAAKEEIRQAGSRLAEATSHFTELETKLADNQNEIAKLETGLAKFIESLKATALKTWRSIAWILAAVILGPPAWRSARFFVAKQYLPAFPAIQLAARQSSLSQINCSVSSRGLTVPVSECLALIARADWVEERDNDVTTQNRFFWKLTAPAVSYMAEMVPCARIVSNSTSAKSIRLTSSKQDEYITEIQLAETSRICLRPSCIVAATESVSVSSRWRLRSLHAWLTGQLRFIVLSGPGSVYLCGAGGIEASRVSGSRKSMAANCVVGFEPHLHYSASVANNFFPYFLGRVPLLQIQFEGDGNVIRLLVADGQRSSMTQKAGSHIFTALGKLLGF